MSDNRTCPNCGAPVLSEICQYCGTVIENVSTAELASEYPTVECKLARISFSEAVFYASVAGIPGAIGIYVLTQALWIEDALFAIPFLLPAIIIGVLLFKRIKAVISVAMNGTDMTGEVYGYLNDSVMQDEEPWQIVKVLVQTSEGKKFILLPLRKTSKPYPVNSKVKVRAYQEFATISKMKEEIKW